MTRRAYVAASLIAATLAATLASPARAADPAIDTIPDGQPVDVTCDTSVLWLDSQPFSSSQGKITLRLTFTGRDGDSRTGTWSVASVGDKHDRSFAGRTKEQCAKGCVLRLAIADTTGQSASEQQREVRRQLELWAPNPSGIDKLADDQELTLATFKLPSLDLKASMFRGRTPLGFEQGPCTLALDTAKPEAAPNTPTSSPSPIPPAETESTPK